MSASKLVQINHDKFLNLASEGSLSGVQQSVKDGCSLECKDKFEHTPLMRACMNGHEPVAKWLLAEKAKIDSSNHYNQTSLMLAAGANHINVVRSLVEKNANIEYKDKEGWTPLMIAAHRDGSNQFEICEYLLEHKADVHTKNKDNKNAADIAKGAEVKLYLQSVLKKPKNIVDESIKHNMLNLSN